MISIKRILLITDLQFKTLFRNFKSNAIMFLLPVIFMGIFGLVFSASSDDVTFKIGIVDQTKSEESPFLSIIEELENPNGASLFTIIEFENDTDGKDALSRNEITLLLKIPEQFYPGQYVEALALTAKPNDPNTGTISAIITSVASEYLGIDQGFIQTNYTTNGNGDIKPFDFIAPGMMVYGILILLPNVANSYVNIIEKKQMFRYFTSKTRASEIIIGNTLYLIVIGMIQIVLLYSTAVALGFNAVGSVWDAVLVAIPTTLFVIGVGLLIGAFTRKSEAAANLATMISVVLGFLSGSFIAGIGQVLEFDLFGRVFQFNDFIPSKWATVALELILREGKTVSDVSSEILVITVSSILIFAVGVVLYNRNQMRRLE